MADQRAKLARDQAATALVLMGAIAQSRDDRAVALTAFDGALSHRPRDPDATKLIGMLRPAEAVKRFSDLEDIAVELEDKSLEAEALRLKASALGPGNNARQALQEAASIEENITPKNFGRLGQTYRQWADVSAQLDGHNGTPWRAIGRYEKAAEYFLLDGDRTAADAAAALAKALIGGQRKPPEPLSTI